MWLHRLFCIPHGLEASEGVYLRYPAEELYAILSLESHRHRSLLLGEDLGTVPDIVRTTMAAHEVHRMYVGQFEIRPDPQGAVGSASASSVASLNTHDTPLFAAFWQGLDIHSRVELGLLDDQGARVEEVNRQRLRHSLEQVLRRAGWLDGASEPFTVLEAWLKYLAASDARIVLVNLEDLWLEVQPQNVPGTGYERPNWLRKACHPLEAIQAMPRVLNTLREVDAIRRRA